MPKLLLVIFAMALAAVAQDQPAQLVARPAKPVFHIGEPIVLEVACTSSEPNAYLDWCSQARLRPVVYREQPSLTTSSLEQALGFCYRFGGGIYRVPAHPTRLMTEEPVWHAVTLPYFSYPTTAGEFPILVSAVIPNTGHGKLDLTATTTVTIDTNPEWVSARVHDLSLRYATATPVEREQLGSEFSILPGDEALRTAIDLFDNRVEFDPLVDVIQEAANQSLAVTLLEQRMLQSNFHLDTNILWILTGMRMRLDFPQQLKALESPTEKHDALLEDRAREYLAGLAHRLVSDGDLTGPRYAEVQKVIEQLAGRQWCGSAHPPLSKNEAQQLLAQLKRASNASRPRP